MISVEAYHEKVLALVDAPLETVTVPAEGALGYALARDIVAPIALPPFDNSAMDGYAVRTADVTEPGELKVSDDIAAGVNPAPLEPATAARIMTGAPVPEGADAVVPVEWTDGGTTTVHFERAPQVGANIRLAGEDVRPGTTVLHAGDELTPARLGAVASLGCDQVVVHRRPRVAVLSTGSELVAPGSALRAGAVYDSNGPLLAACVQAAGAEVVRHPLVADDVRAGRQAIDELVSNVDVLVTSGGISAGAYEVVKDVLGSDLNFVKVAMQPGMPQGCGRSDGCAIITVPGNPVSAFVSFELFVRPVIRRLAGHRIVDRQLRQSRLAESVRRHPTKQQYLRVVWTNEGAVRPFGGTGSHLLAALAQAEALAIIPPGEEAAAVNAPVDVIDITQS